MSTILSSLALDDEIAFKLDSHSFFKYKGEEDPIEHLTLIASDVGIVPVIQLLKRIFKDQLFNIENCDLLWINPTKESFILSHEMDKLEKEYGDKLRVAKIQDTHINDDNSTTIHYKLQDVIPHYQYGRISIVSSGNKNVLKKFDSVLSRSLNYSKENILLVEN
jgi:NAD(P)H-flavin reductase